MAKHNERPKGNELAQRAPDAMAVGDDESGAMDVVRQGLTAQTLRTRVVTAQRVAVPRNLAKVTEAVKREAALVGEDFEYRWTVGAGSEISGVSVDGAMIMLRNFGNCDCEVEIAEDAPRHWILRATFIDWETGFTLSRLFRQRKDNAVHGRMDEDRKLDIAFQIGQSKAQRNAIMKALPVWLVKSAIEAAQDATEAKIDIAVEREKNLKYWAKAGVTQAMLEGKIGAPIDAWSKRDYVRLRALWNALREKETTKEVEFPELAPKTALPASTEAPAAPAAPAAAPSDPDPMTAPPAAPSEPKGSA